MTGASEVAEVAFLQLSVDYDPEELRDILQKTQQIQAQWIRLHQPKLLEGKPYNHTTEIWIGEHEKPYMLLTAPWESVDAHNQWIQSQENMSLMQKLKGFISQDKDSVVLYHLTPAGGNNDFRGDILARGPVKLWKITVKPECKAKLEEEYRAIESQSSTEPNQRMWAGWKIEKEGTEDMVILASPGFEEVVESGIAVKFEDAQVSRFEHKPFIH
ncbi:hypothetical protein SNK03_011936 [Fusarium graminearum]|uniref:Chromosome 3, complete genome n=1 Tax=Gibberella zeae (strain ATCC MYA-4620 / CBS 123657 / FGSC 9075 / NRRL 31084 / PH-1) TaxID=229533 RepID=I1RPE8_GIBZE|nr:hypothetical protein FGSG_05915 [Fusarium graminearum PH-1]EYB32959.1 hypothetical protein FG05_05915 [Fusarium graminearum]ESU11948.1 hypothetical protein FGSG_05915 [Fusarium graminearum PH-1]KAI6751917.1 hypothetical protein HG531_006613 [Fusarium graminearum]PCD32002.1 hypothetical protein FGRA07_10001 [Fusarium graminearum]CAF3584603.1 unnamed protein product [Fusarium graminearum]|eukprot:XP_011324524.1 hypothetical protein FGSG_05915 [Fusarium graminearum PH-1]